MAIRVHLLSSDDYAFSTDEEEMIVAETEQAEPAIRSLLPGLRNRLNLVVTTGTDVIPETGEVGFAASPDVVNWTVDPARGVADVAHQHVRHMLFHELHHCETHSDSELPHRGLVRRIGVRGPRDRV